MNLRPTRRFAFRLALALGVWDVDAMLERMSSGLLTEWEAFFRLEPWGAEVENRRFALVAATIANMLRGERTRPYKLDDFLLRSVAATELDEEQRSRLLLEQLKARLR